MPRTSQEQTQERHAFLLDLFRSQPDISRPDAMEAFKDKFGSSINLKTFNQLRDQAQKDAETSDDGDTRADERAEASEPVEDSASRLKSAASPDLLNGGAAGPAKKPKAKTAGAKNVFVDASQEQLAFLERIVNQLQEAGANNLRIDHSTDRWMVIVVDAK